MTHRNKPRITHKIDTKKVVKTLIKDYEWAIDYLADK